MMRVVGREEACALKVVEAARSSRSHLKYHTCTQHRLDSDCMQSGKQLTHLMRSRTVVSCFAWKRGCLHAQPRRCKEQGGRDERMSS